MSELWFILEAWNLWIHEEIETIYTEFEFQEYKKCEEDN